MLNEIPLDYREKLHLLAFYVQRHDQFKDVLEPGMFLDPYLIEIAHYRSEIEKKYPGEPVPWGLFSGLLHANLLSRRKEDFWKIVKQRIRWMRNLDLRRPKVWRGVSADYIRRVRTIEALRLAEKNMNQGQFEKIPEQFRFLTEQESVNGFHPLGLEKLNQFWKEGSRTTKWLVQDIIPWGALVLITAPAGLYKTWLNLWLAHCLLEGEPFLGHQTEKCKHVWYFDRENSASTFDERARMFGLQNKLGVLGGWSDPPAPMLGDPWYEAMARQYKPVMMFDTLRPFHEAEENSSTEMSEVFATLKRIRNAGATIIVQYHPTKGQEYFYRGSSDIGAQIDVGFQLKKRKDLPEYLFLYCEKTRYTENFDIKLLPQIGSLPPFQVIRDIKQAERKKKKDALLHFIRKHPWLSQTKIETRFTGDVVVIRSLIKELRSEGNLKYRRNRGKGGGFIYSAVAENETPLGTIT